MSTYKIQLRGDISSNWSSVNPILDSRELAIEEDTLAFKIGNGVLNWNSLPYANVSTAGANMSFSAGTIALQDNISLNSVSATTYYNVPMDLSFAVSDETTAITSGTSKITLYAPYAFTITAVKASLSTSGSTSTTIDVNVGGSSIFSTRPTIDANEFSTSTAAAPSVLSATTVSADQKITIDIDGAGTSAAGLKVYILGKRNS